MTPFDVIDANDQIIEADLEGSTYNVTLSWNEEGQLWTLDLKSLDNEQLASGIAVVPRSPLLRWVRRPWMPRGELIVWTPISTALTRQSFFNGDATLCYVTRDEIANGTV